MKNLPEKIYLNINMTPQEVVETKDKDFHEATKTWEITWSEECLSEHDPEYIRKDAFIDKTFEFFGEHLWEYIDVKNANCDTFINIDSDKLKEDFKNYMKGK
jgi:hypothetical protein